MSAPGLTWLVGVSCGDWSPTMPFNTKHKNLNILNKRLNIVFMVYTFEKLLMFSQIIFL